jgi:hypothetical protein
MPNALALLPTVSLMPIDLEMGGNKPGNAYADIFLSLNKKKKTWEKV